MALHLRLQLFIIYAQCKYEIWYRKLSPVKHDDLACAMRSRLITWILKDIASRFSNYQSHPMSLLETSSSSVSPDALAAAVELRIRQAVQQKSIAQEASEHEKRQKFRRMIDPGIMRPNAHDQALRSLKVYALPYLSSHGLTYQQTLLKISENLILEPNNEKYQRFKPTNSVIKRDLMDPKGALEYAREASIVPYSPLKPI